MVLGVSNWTDSRRQLIHKSGVRWKERFGSHWHIDLN